MSASADSPAAEVGYPRLDLPHDHVQPAPRRVRGVLGGSVVFDTTRALYVWEWPFYPQYYIPHADCDAGALVDEQHVQRLRRGPVHLYGLRVGELSRPAAARLHTGEVIERLADMVRFEWKALDAWYEEDERVFVHPRNPYTRVDALRSTRSVRVELGGVLLAQSASPVMVFETGLPTRYYLNRTEVHLEHLTPSETVTACPYKGTTSGYWSARIAGEVHEDIAWTYDFPTRQLLPIAGLVGFYNEKVDLILDGERLARPKTHFSD